MSSEIIPVIVGVLFMAFGSAALNHYQEKDFDAKMDRTKNRPIPANKISANDALKISIILMARLRKNSN